MPTTCTQRTAVMSCTAHVVVVADGHAEAASIAGVAIERLHDLETRWSRFLPDSEVSRLNRSQGATVAVSIETAQLVTAMAEAWHLTEGAYDPTMLGALVRLGYDRSRTDASCRTELGAGIADRGEPGALAVDTNTSCVHLPVGTAIDPGGIGKGLAADIVTSEAMAAGAHGALVEIGGDIRVRGVAPQSAAWTISVAGRTVSLADGGVATSTSEKRTWSPSRDGDERHHLIDPRHLTPTKSDVVECSVIAGSGATAEAFTKVAFVREVPSAMRQYDSHGLAANVRLTTGERISTTMWDEFTS